MGQIIRKWKDDGKTVIIAEHKLFFLKDVVDRAIYIQNGRIANEWPMYEFKNLNHRNLGLRQLDLDNLSVKHNNYYSDKQDFIKFKNFNFNYNRKQALTIDDVDVPKN